MNIEPNSNAWKTGTPQSIQSNARKVLSNSISALITGGLMYTAGVQRSQATTYFDTDVYGDKELKIATVNKTKQKVRNAILANPALASAFLKLAINDGLGYSIEDKDGGLDGSVLYEMDGVQNSGLQNALLALQQIQKELQRT
jgi:hypothetical protein